MPVRGHAQLPQTGHHRPNVPHRRWHVRALSDVYNAYWEGSHAVVSRDEGQPPNPRERFVKLAPLEVEMEEKLASIARNFFSPAQYSDFCKFMGKNSQSKSIKPFSASEFLDFLGKLKLLKEPQQYIYHVRHLLERMASNNIIVETDSSNRNAMMPKSYFTFSEISNLQSQGSLWLAKTLGGRFVHKKVSPAIVHITGKDKYGDQRHGGSGVIFDANHVLTCRHVISDMYVNQNQRFQGKDVEVEDIKKHPEIDIAVVRVNTSLNPIPGLGFLSPVVLQPVFTFGYPKIPCVRPRIPDSEESYLIAQRGEVTNEHVIASNKSEIFLYSAIARPGNSGGAIVSDDGYVVGISTDLTEGKYEGDGLISPYYAGIPAHVVAKAVNELSLGVRIPYETFA